MANYFHQNSNPTLVPNSRFNLNTQSLNNSEHPDLATLTMSLANTQLSSFPNTSPSQRMASGRGSRNFMQGSGFQTAQNLDTNSWLDRSRVMNQLTGNSPCISGRFGTPRNLDDPRSLVGGNRMPMINDNMGFPDMSVQRSSRLPIPPSGDVFGQLMSAAPSTSHTALPPQNHRPTLPSQPEVTSLWAMYPPVPPFGSEHLRTGRYHVMRSSTPDNNAPTYMEQALLDGLKSKLRDCLPSSEINSKFPTQVGPYTAVEPLESGVGSSRSLEVVSQCFRAWCPVFSRHVVLRRVVLDAGKVLPRKAFLLAKEFADSRDSTVLRLLNVVPVSDFNDNSLLFAYDFLPCVRTLHEMHMADHSKSPDQVSPTDMIAEKTAWSLLVQLTQSIRFAHKKVNRGLGCLDATKILIQDGKRVFLNGFGVKDLVYYPSLDSQRPEYKANDLVALGKIMLGTICGTSLALEKPGDYLPLVERSFSRELSGLLGSLISGSTRSVDEVILTTADRVYDNLDVAESLVSNLERRLMHELSNGRLFRLICKLNTVIERQDPRQLPDPDWSETDERYMLKLFRDFVFHQVDENGAPYLDLAHIITALNKVEAGSSEKICLVSRGHVVIATYANVREWLDRSFSHLVEDCRRSVFEQQMAQGKLDKP